MLGNNIAVAFLSKTKLTSEKSTTIRGYTIFKKDRLGTGQHQGVLLAIKSNINHEPVPLPLLSTVEPIVIIIFFQLRPINNIGIYYSPSSLNDTQDIHAVMNIDQSIIITGDFNIKHSYFSSRNTNQNGKRLYAFPQNSLISVLSQYRPTYFPTNGNRPDVLD